VCLGLTFVVSALPTGGLVEETSVRRREKKVWYREAEGSGSYPALAVRDQPAAANGSKAHLKIAIISTVAVVVFCALVFSLYRWRVLLFRRQKQQFPSVISSPLGGFAPTEHRGTGTASPMSERRHSEILFGGYDTPARPAPVHQRAPQPTTLGTFFLADDDEVAPLPSGPRAKVPSRKTKRQSLKLAIQPSHPNGSTVPDSPAAAKEMTRFSWGTAASEKPKFRTVLSWVDNQAERWNPASAGGDGEGGGGKTPVTLEPSTPAVCRQHPGVPVMLARPERVDSMYLDRRLGERY